MNSIIWNNYSNDLIEYSIDTDFNLNYSILSHEYNGDGNKFLYPEFSNLENFNLSRVSNALGAGEYNSNIPITDIYGNIRIDSFEGNYQSIDIGAIEFPLDSIEYKNWFVSFNGNDNNNGENPNLPFKHINYAVSKALNGDRIYVQNGTYNENILFNGKNVKLMNKRYYDDGQNFECGFIEDSFIEDLIIEPLNNTPVIQILEGENNVELCGFTITDGEANYGSGIFINNANPTIHSINIVNNYSLVDGGGLYGDNFNGQLHNIKIIGNISAGNGAGIFLNNSSPSLKNILISENMNRVTNYNLNGGGMYLSNSNISNMEYVTFLENHASNNGGGLYLDNCTIEEAIGFEFYSNFSNKDGGAIYSLNSSINFEGELLTQIIQNVADINGGAIYANASNINATSVQINENFASQDGGGIYINNESIVIMKDSELNSNTAVEDGGAIYMNGYDIEIDLEFCSIINNVSETTSILYANNGKVNMKNILIEGNRSTNYPGGILSKNSDISLFNITITNNDVLNPGAGGNLNIENYGKLNLVNSIVWDNDGVGVYLRDDGSHKSFLATHSNLSNGRQGINYSTSDSIYYYAEYNYSSDPKFISPEEGFYYITKESHCVDAGISLFPPNAGSSGIDTLLYITEDEMVDGNGDGIKMPDIGAYDKRILSVYPGDLNHDGSVNIGDILNIIKYFNIKGIPRYSKGINWKEDGYGAVAWNNYDNISGLALTYTDANGDGVINERDLLSIGLNWENSHPFGVTGFSLNMDEKDIIENHSLELNQLYNSLSGQGDGFSEIKSYLESLLNLSSLPIKFDLGDNYPNPFNPITFIPFSLAENSLVSINIFDLKGKLINEFMSNKKYNKGYHKVKFNADDLPSGLYFSSIKTNNWVKTKKMMLVK